MCEFTEMYKKKFEASEELKSVEISVQKAMIIKNKELSELAVLQKIDILQRQIDTAEDGWRLSKSAKIIRNRILYRIALRQRSVNTSKISKIFEIRYSGQGLVFRRLLFTAQYHPIELPNTHVNICNHHLSNITIAVSNPHNRL